MLITCWPSKTTLFRRASKYPFTRLWQTDRHLSPPRSCSSPGIAAQSCRARLSVGQNMAVSKNTLASKKIQRLTSKLNSLSVLCLFEPGTEIMSNSYPGMKLVYPVGCLTSTAWRLYLCQPGCKHFATVVAPRIYRIEQSPHFIYLSLFYAQNQCMRFYDACHRAINASVLLMYFYDVLLSSSRCFPILRYCPNGYKF